MGRDRTKQLSFPFAGKVRPKPVVRRRRLARVKAGRRAVLQQPTLPLGKPVDPARVELLRRRVEAHLDGPLELVVTDNRCTVLSVRRLPTGGYRLRVHHMFLEAKPRVIRALAWYAMGQEKLASEVLDEFIEANQDKMKSSTGRRREQVLRTKGQVWDLAEILDSLNQRFFEGKLQVKITWGRRPRGRPRRHRSIKMGSYSYEDKLIRIHPALDREFVPRFFIESVVYHEMLHHVHPIPVKDGRRQFHTPEFRAQEQAFPHYAAAKRWEQLNIDRLLYF